MSKRQEFRERRRKQKQQRKMITIGSIIVGAGLIAAALIYPSLQQVEGEFRPRETAQDNAMGDPEAPIKIVEYSDFKCSHCAAFLFDTEPLLEETYIKTGKVYFVSRTVGAMLSGAEPMLASEAVYCAGEQGKYWELHDLIFANQNMTFTTLLMNNWAKTAGVPDLNQFKDCMSDNTYVERANQDEADARAEGVSGTPAFVISYIVDGEEVKEMIPGNLPFSSFRQVIEEALTKMGE